MGTRKKRERILKDRKELLRYLLITLYRGCQKCGSIKGFKKITENTKISPQTLIFFLTRSKIVTDASIEKLEWVVWRKLNGAISIPEGETEDKQQVEGVQGDL